jgi:hypothetical protein
MYTQEAINNNSINTRNKYYRAMVDYKFNKLADNNTVNIVNTLNNPNLTKKDLYYIALYMNDCKRDIMDEDASCIQSDMVTFDHKKLTINIVNKDDTDIEDIVYGLKEDVTEIIQEAIVNINANTFANDYILKKSMRDMPPTRVSNNAILYRSIDVLNLMSKIPFAVTTGNIIKDDYKLSCISILLNGKLTRHNALFILNSFDEKDPVDYWISKISRALLESPQIIKSINAKTRDIKFKKGFSIDTVEDCAIRVMSRVFDAIKLDIESVNYALTLFKEENKDTYGLPDDAVEFLDYFYKGIKAGYLPYKMIYLDGDIGSNYMLNLITDVNAGYPSVNDYKKQLDELTYANIVDCIIRYHEDRLR